MEINYEKIQQSINKYGQYILCCIRNQYSNSLTDEQLQNIDKLLNTQFIIIERPSNEDIEFFSKQDGIKNPANYSIDYVPSAHGGRTKDDNKIHIYPYTKSFSNCTSDDEIIKSCIDDIVVHEIFHYFIRPNVSNENDPVKDEFGHFIAEGLVQYYAEKFAKEFRLGEAKSNYGKNVEFAKKLISSFPSDLTQSQIDRIIFTTKQEQLLEIAQNGKSMYEGYISDLHFQKNISSFVIEMGLSIGMSEDDSKIQQFIKRYQKMSDVNIVFAELSKNIEIVFKDMEMKNNFMLKLKTIISDKKLEQEMFRYEEQMKSFLPIEEQLKKLKRNGKSLEEIKSALGNNSTILDYVPTTLYHGSLESLDVISPQESTQKGKYVYATDNPIHALFFSMFRNSSIARAHIAEYIDANGNYKVKYQIDERIKGALDEIISDKDITIHVCNGEQFFKPQGEAYISREWISKDGQSIVPIDKIHVNVRHFFENLEKQGLVEYDRYDKSKNWKTVIDMLGQNYPFGLETNRGTNLQEYNALYDEFIGTNFPEQLEFSKKFRSFVNEVMKTDYKSENPNMSEDEEINYKLRQIKNTANSFLVAHKDNQGKIIFEADMNKLKTFQNQSDSLSREKGRSL